LSALPLENGTLKSHPADEAGKNHRHRCTGWQTDVSKTFQRCFDFVNLTRLTGR
jgi:hypothetical protein